MRPLSHCPTCGEELRVKTLFCPACHLEISNDFSRSAFDRLREDEMQFLLTFLSARGNLKSVQERLGISYPTAKRQLERLLAALGLEESKTEECSMLKLFHKTGAVTDASTIIRNKLIACGGKATIYSYSGKTYEIRLSRDGESIACDALPNVPYKLKVFDDIVNMLRREGGRAPKGQTRGVRVGSAQCNEHTVAGTIAIEYWGKSTGETTLDPQAVLNAVLAWADIVENGRGYLALTASYRLMLKDV